MPYDGGQEGIQQIQVRMRMADKARLYGVAAYDHMR